MKKLNLILGIVAKSFLEACYKTGAQNQDLIGWHINNNYNKKQLTNPTVHFPQGIYCISQLQVTHNHFLSLMANSEGRGHLSCQMPHDGDEKKGQIHRPQSTLQHFSFIAQ